MLAWLRFDGHLLLPHARHGPRRMANLRFILVARDISHLEFKVAMGLRALYRLRLQMRPVFIQSRLTVVADTDLLAGPVINACNFAVMVRVVNHCVLTRRKVI